MRILLLTTHLEMGGIPVYLVTLARALKRRGHSPEVASSGGWFEAQLAQEGIPHHRIRCDTSNELHPRLWLEVFPSLLAILRRDNIQVIHANTRVTQVLGSVLSGLTGVPMVATCHGFYGRKLGRRFFPCWGKKVIAISNSTLDRLVQQYKMVSPDQAVLVHNGIEVDRFLQPPDPKTVDRFRQAWGLKGRPVVGTIARLSSVKGQEFLVRSAPGLLKQFPDLMVLLIGEGPEREKLVRLAYELKIQDHLVIAPSVEEIRIPLAAMDLFVYPSLQEGFGLAIVEAMAAGVPVVATRSGGPSDIIEEGVNGLLVPPGDAEALGAAIRSLLADPARRQRIAQAARERAKTHFNMERVTLETEHVYAHPSRGSRKRILIVAVNWLGDLIFMTPAIRAIRRAYPEAFIACLAPRQGMELLESNPHLNQVISFEESRGLGGFFRWLGMVSRLRAERYDTVYLFHLSFTRALVVWLAGIPSRIGYRTWKQRRLLTQSNAALSKSSVHKAVWYLTMLEADAVSPAGLEYDLVLKGEDREAADRLLKEWGVRNGDRLVALHAGANWTPKRWPAASFARLADDLAGRFQARPVFIGAGQDIPLIEEIQRQMKTQPLIAAGRTTLRQSGALLARSAVLVSNDSGPLHLALAVGTPVVGLFGPTSPELSGPYFGAKAVSLASSTGCMQEIQVEQALAAASSFLAPVRPEPPSARLRTGFDSADHPEPFGSAQGRPVEG